MSSIQVAGQDGTLGDGRMRESEITSLDETGIKYCCRKAISKGVRRSHIASEHINLETPLVFYG